MGGTVSRPDLVQFIPGTALPGVYTYNASIRDHYTWNELAVESFTFEKLPGEDSPGSKDAWSLFGWEEVGDSRKSPPEGLAIHSVYPNPFNPTTTISFQLPVERKVSLGIFDVRGRLIELPLQNDWLKAGEHFVTFNGSNLASGVYFYRLTAENFEASGMLLLIK
jgi:hypothetical protein